MKIELTETEYELLQTFASGFCFLANVLFRAAAEAEFAVSWDLNMTFSAEHKNHPPQNER